MRPELGTGAESTPGEFVLDTTQSRYKLSGPHIHRDTWVFLLPPSTNTSVLVGFTPLDAHASSTILLLRSDFTTVEENMLVEIWRFKSNFINEWTFATSGII